MRSVGRALPAGDADEPRAQSERLDDATKPRREERNARRGATHIPQLVAGSLWTLLAATLVILGVAGRLLPHPPKFTPLAAIALFGGFLFRDVRLAIAVPLGAMILSDAVLGTYDLRIMATVYAALLFPIVFRGWLRHRLTPLRVLCSAGVASLFFFLTTNFAVWAVSGMYARTSAGLVACYVAALPFFKYTVAGDLLWCTALFGLYAVVREVATRRVSVASGAAAAVA